MAVTSQTVIDEILKQPPKIAKSRQEIEEFFLSFPLLIRKRVNQKEAEKFQGLTEPKDVHVIAGAKLTGCQYLLTLDKKHLLKKEVQEKVQPLQIITPKDLILELLG